MAVRRLTGANRRRSEGRTPEAPRGRAGPLTRASPTGPGNVRSTPDGDEPAGAHPPNADGLIRKGMSAPWVGRRFDEVPEP